MADTSDVTVAYAVDTNPGAAIPSGTAWQLLNFVSEDFAPQNDSVRSKVITPNADVKDSRRFSQGSTGTLAMELARDPELEALMAIALRGAWVSNVLKAGTARSYVMFEEKVTEGANPFYSRYRGCMLGGFTLAASTDGLVDITFPIMGTTIEDGGSATTASATYVQPGSATVAAGVDFTTLTLGGFTNQLDASSVNIDLTNNGRADRKLGSAAPRSTSWGKREVTLTATVFFEDNEAFSKYLANGVQAVSFGFTPPGGTAGFDFSAARVRLDGYSKPIPGENQTIMVTLNMTATFDPTDATAFKVTRRT